MLIQDCTVCDGWSYDLSNAGALVKGREIQVSNKLRQTLLFLWLFKFNSGFHKPQFKKKLWIFRVVYYEPFCVLNFQYGIRVEQEHFEFMIFLNE